MSTLSIKQAAAAELALVVTYRKTSELSPDPKSARQHGKSQLKKLARSIQEFGFVVPILVDANGGVIAGTARLLAAKHLGLLQVPTIELAHLSEAQLAVYKIADNRLNELSSWNDKVLAEQLLDLSLLNLDFSLELTGFDMGEIDLRIEGLEIAPEKGRADPADAVDLLHGPAVTAPGDFWLLGAHRVICASALAPES